MSLDGSARASALHLKITLILAILTFGMACSHSDAVKLQLAFTSNNYMKRNIWNFRMTKAAVQPMPKEGA